MTQDRISDTQVTGPGARLMQARLDLHLAREDVSAKLHMSSRQIQALEEDDYTVLPGATYVRGYLRNYAVMLGLDPATILAAHAQITAKATHAESEHAVPRREITSRHHQIRFTTYLVAFVVIGLAVAWWQGRDVRPPNPLLTSQEPAAEPSTPADAVSAPVAELPPQKTPAAAPRPTKPESTTAGTAVSSISAPTPPVMPVGPHGKLVLYADRDSWVDIRDGHQAKLAYETLQAGRVLTFDATTPISVFLGNAAGVRAEYNGKPVDIAKFRAGVTARFSLSDSVQTATPAPAPAPAQILTPAPAQNR